MHPRGWIRSGSHQQRRVESSGLATSQMHSGASWCQDTDRAEVEGVAISKHLGTREGLRSVPFGLYWLQQATSKKEMH